MHQVVAQSSKTSQHKPEQNIQPLKPTLKAKPRAPGSIYFLLEMQVEKSHPISSIHVSNSLKLPKPQAASSGFTQAEPGVKSLTALVQSLGNYSSEQ